jgi:hypothetical protein
MKEVSNQKLCLNDILGDDALELEPPEFALSFNGYNAYPESEASEGCSDIANRRDLSSLSRVRACFFLSRGDLDNPMWAGITSMCFSCWQQ